MSGCANSRTRGVAGTEFPKFVHALGRAAALKVAPEMKLHRRLAARAALTHELVFRAAPT